MYEAFSMKVTDIFKKDFAIPGIKTAYKIHSENNLETPSGRHENSSFE